MGKRKHAAKPTTKSQDRIPVSPLAGYWPKSIGVVVGGCLALCFFIQEVLSSPASAAGIISGQTWQTLVTSLGGQIYLDPTTESAVCNVPLLGLFSILAGFSAFTLIALGAAIRFNARRNPSPDALSMVEQICQVCIRGWRWWVIPWCWEMTQILFHFGGFETTMVVMSTMYHYIAAIALAGWLAELVRPLIPELGRQPTGNTSGKLNDSASSRSIPFLLLGGVAAYVVVFTVMNWQLYQGLLVPHGDSVMYEEHLWNVLSGKGFRSYLDQGLFLGEHIQVIHLALLPIYSLWPSHLLLELSESLALASGAIPISWMARRWSGSTISALCLALAYLLYSPLQFLDIAIDLKTFRPICYGVPAILFALDQLERGRVKSTIVLFIIALAAKEDFALIMGPLGLWLAAQPLLNRSQSTMKDAVAPPLLSNHKLALRYGIGLSIASVGYLLLVMRVLIPWFRDGKEVHYASYFDKFGKSTGEIIINMLTNPGLLIEQLVTIPSIVYLLALLLPLAFLPLLSPSRFAVAVPILVLLCLNKIVIDDPRPWHHFHAPAVPVLFWAAAHSLHRFRAGAPGVIGKLKSYLFGAGTQQTAVFAFALCAFVGSTTGMSPLSIQFWDSGSRTHWRSLYIPGERQ